MRQAEIGSRLNGHGGRIDVAADLYPNAPQPWIDLSTGINPLPWQGVEGLSVDARSLPTSASLRTLEAAAASHFGVDPARVSALPGSEIGLRLLPFVGVAKPLSRVGPGYVTHRDVAPHATSIDQLDRGVKGSILLANPNNPDGRVLSPTRLANLAAMQQREGGWLIVDEAFADVTPETSLLPALDEDAPAIVFRSFGKFFGLAGLRLGFVVAPSALRLKFRSLLGDWPVSAHAIAVGTAAYRDIAWIARTRAELQARADRLDRLLMRHGLGATGACPLFRLVEHHDAAHVFERLAHAGILTRAFDYTPTWLRFGLPADDQAFGRLDLALAHG